MTKDEYQCEIFSMEFSASPEMPFAISIPVTPTRSVVGLFRDKEICRKCCEALNRSVMRIVRSWHLKEYEQQTFLNKIEIGDNLNL